MLGSGEIMVKSIVQQLPHLLYCDLPPHQNLAMKLGIRVDVILIQNPTKFDGMSMKRVSVRHNKLSETPKIRALASQSKQKRIGAN